jgi:hypothetical protein
MWWWQPGDRGCLDRSTGPGLFPIPDAVVARDAEQTRVRFRLGLHAPAKPGGPPYADFDLVLRGDSIRTDEGKVVAITRRSALDVPGFHRDLP